MKTVQKKYISVVILWQPQNTQTKSRNCRRTSKLHRLFSWGTSAEAYMTYFKFDRCTVNLMWKSKRKNSDIAASYVHKTAVKGLQTTVLRMYNVNYTDFLVLKQKLQIKFYQWFQFWNFMNPFTPKIVLVIPLTICRTIFWYYLGEFSIGST